MQEIFFCRSANTVQLFSQSQRLPRGLQFEMTPRKQEYFLNWELNIRVLDTRPKAKGVIIYHE